MSLIDNSVITLLKRLGLNSYEAKLYSALVLLGSATVSEVSKLADVPETSAYRVLDGLTSKGWINVVPGRPTIYHAVNPEVIEERVIRDIKHGFKLLKDAYQKASKTERPEIIYTIHGKERVLAKIKEIISDAKQFLFISAPYESLSDLISFLKTKSIEIKIITDEPTKLVQTLEYRISKPLFAIDILADYSQALIAMPDLSVCGWANNPLIAKHFGQFLELKWALAGKI